MTVEDLLSEIVDTPQNARSYEVVVDIAGNDIEDDGSPVQAYGLSSDDVEWDHQERRVIIKLA